MQRRIVMTALALLPLLTLTSPVQTTAQAKGTTMNTAVQPAKPRDGSRDFDFLFGKWKVHNQRLKERLKGSTEWQEFAALSTARPILNRTANQDEFTTDFWPDYMGMSFRFYNPATDEWSIYWAYTKSVNLEPPVVGRFEGNRGVFTCADTFEGRPITVRYIWSHIDTPNPRWEQAFSEDGGKTWETNWKMTFTRIE